MSREERSPDAAGQAALPARYASARVRLNEEGVVLRRLDEELVVYEFLVGGFYQLNKAARLIVDQIDGKRSLADLATCVHALSGGAIEPQDTYETVIELKELHVVELIPADDGE